MPEFVPLFFCLLIPFAIIGLGLINAGLNRTRSAAHSMLGSMCAASAAVLAFAIIGSSLAAPHGHIIQLAGKQFAWLGAGPLFSRNPENAVVLLFELFSVALAVQLPLASGAERWRLSALCVSATSFAALQFPMVAFWIWSGFLSQLGTNYGLGRGFIDAGGAGAIQVVGGINALVIAWLLGPRHGKFTSQGIPTAMPGHNAVIVVAGSLLALLGWIGLAAAGAILFYHCDFPAVLAAIINTLIAASSGALGALVTTRIKFGKSDTSLTANGWVCALVAVSAGAPFLKIPEAIIVGLAAGIIVVFAVELVEARLRVDDPAGAISVHTIGGMWGLLAVGMFAETSSGQFLAQLVGIGCILGIELPIAYAINSAINHFQPYRVDKTGERQGLDLYELGAGAYPEFMTHREDFLRR